MKSFQDFKSKALECINQQDKNQSRIRNNSWALG